MISKHIDGTEKMIITQDFANRFGGQEMGRSVSPSYRLFQAYYHAIDEYRPAWMYERLAESWILIKFFTYYKGE
jgi:hypothetical protein